MGKIGILTFHRSVNNGAVMQAYSLSKHLMLEYPDMEVEIIDFHMKKVEDAYSYSFWKYVKDPNPYLMLKKTAKLILNPGTIRRLNKRTKIFEGISNILPLSDVCIIDDATERIFEYINDIYDVLIVGSDAVWNYVSRGFPNAYFPDETVSCPKMSYAASCYGMEFTEYSKENRARIEEILNDFSFIGVRDVATENFVKWSNCSQIAYHTCDPTAFLDVNKLPINIKELELKLKKRGMDFNRPIIGMMGNDKMCSMIRSFYGKKYQIIALYEYIKDADVNLYDLTPYEWAYVFRYFKITFTTYFHGTMLSLRNGVPVICIALPTEFAKKHTPKTLDVLKRLGFDDWYFHTDYKGENYESIKKMSDKLLIEDYKERILVSIDKEAESFDTFKQALDIVLKNINIKEK